jgi:hypothetical protein
MKQVELLFPNTQILTEFILGYQPSKAEVKSNTCSLSAELNDQQIAIACYSFDAVLKDSFVLN